MDIYEAIRTRHTVRDFQDRPLERATVERLIEAGLCAPTNNHMREWEFVAVNSRAARRALLAAISQTNGEAEAIRILDDWGCADPVQRAMYIDAIPKQHRMLLTAGCLLIPCFRQPRPLLNPETLSSLNPFASIWCCIENILLAAAAEGIFGVTRIPFDAELPLIRSAAHIPDEYAFACYLSLGYPAGAPPVAQRPVRAADRIHVDTW